MTAISLTQRAIEIIHCNGQPALTCACQKILQTSYGDSIIGTALHYYAENVLPNVLPIFPALIHLSCKAVGGQLQNAEPVATAMMLAIASGDIHDDVIDKSKSKFGKKTVYGKFGSDIALLAGDALLIQGVSALQNECNLTSQQHSAITCLLADAMFEIIKAEGIETTLWSKTKVTPQELFSIILLKGSVAELHCKIGGVIGGARGEMLEALASCGRAIGVLATLKEDFVDLANPVELRHRLKHELPPYPMLCAMQDKELHVKLIALCKTAGCSNGELRALVRSVLDSGEVGALAARFAAFGREELLKNALFANSGQAMELSVLLEALSAELVFL